MFTKHNGRGPFEWVSSWLGTPQDRPYRVVDRLTGSFLRGRVGKSVKFKDKEAADRAVEELTSG